MPLVFQPVKRPDPVEPDHGLDEELEKAAEDAKLTLYFINMVVVSAKVPNVDGIFDKSDPFAEVTVGKMIGETPVMENDLNPVWNHKMAFFVPDKPDTFTIRLLDKNSTLADTYIGKCEVPCGKLFESETDNNFSGDVDIQNDSDKTVGTVTINYTCRVMKPIETEIKLNYVNTKLECKAEEQKKTLEVLDESERLRENAIQTLTEKEQEIIQQAELLAEKQKQHATELTEKEKNLLDQAQTIEAKIQEIEEKNVALKEAELQKEQMESKLTEAEQEIMKKAEELEKKQQEAKEALTEKEKEILATAEKLEEKEKLHQAITTQLEQTEALKKEIENELTAKEQIIMEQAKQLEEKSKEMGETLTKKEQELIETSKRLAEKEEAAKTAQEMQDKKQAELDALAKENQKLKEEVGALQNTIKKKEEELQQATEAAQNCSCAIM